MAKAKTESEVMLLTLESVPGHKITQIFGVASVNQDMNDETKLSLAEQARKAGGNAVIGIKVAYGSTTKPMLVPDGGWSQNYHREHHPASIATTIGTIVKAEPEI